MRVPQEKPVEWIASAREDLQALPKPVKFAFGAALYEAQIGEKSSAAKPLSGVGGAHTLEIVENFDTNAYRAVYTVRFPEAIYVLHVFQKKSAQGIKTTQRDLRLLQVRLKQAEEKHEQYLQQLRRGTT